MNIYEKKIISGISAALILCCSLPITSYADVEEPELGTPDVQESGGYYETEPDIYYEESIYYPGTSETELLNLAPYKYTPMEPDEWRNLLAVSARERACQSSNAYPSSASFITSVADSVGLCSVNIFKITDDISQLYFHLVTERNMEVITAKVLSDPENDNDALAGDIIFFKTDKDLPVYDNAGIIVDIDEHKISVACVVDGITTVKGIMRDVFSDADSIVHVAYESSENIIREELERLFPYYNDAVRFGILANIFQESSYNATAIGDNGMSYGLCQWYKERNVSLVNFAVANNLTLDNISTQLRFIKYELDTDERFTTLANILANTENTQFGAYNAGYYFCLIYENPDDTINKSHYRGGIAQATFSYYYPDYAETVPPQEVYLPEIEAKTPERLCLDNMFYLHGDDDLIVFLPSNTEYDTITMDGQLLSSDNYDISYGAMLRLTLKHEYMNSLPSGWHDLSFNSTDRITSMEIRVQEKYLSTEMARPSINTATTAIIITDAPAPRGALDISVKQDNGVVMWYDETICYISTQRSGEKVTAPADCSYFFSSDSDELKLSNVFYIDVSRLNVENTSDISYMFAGAGINTDEFTIIGLNVWDTKNVSNARYTFAETGFGAAKWSIGSLKSWSVSNITDMTGMFKDAGHSSAIWNIGDISHWDTGECISMASMFEGAGYSAREFVLDLRYWNMSNMVSLQAMFKGSGYYSDVYSLNLANWDLSNVRITAELFYNSGYSAKDWSLGEGLEDWNTSNISDMSYMFSGAGFSSIAYCFDFGSWDVGNVENMEGMFQYAGHNSKSFELLNIGRWNTSKVTNMQEMFAYSGFSSSDYVLELGSWNVGSVTNMRGMLASAGYKSASVKLDFTGWDISSVEDMSEMFEKTGYETVSFTLLGLNTWDMSNVKTTESMFSAMAFETYDFEVDLSSWNLSEDINMCYMFRDTGAMSGIFSLNLENWNINPNADTEGCFSNTGNICKYSPPKWYKR